MYTQIGIDGAIRVQILYFGRLQLQVQIFAEGLLMSVQ